MDDSTLLSCGVVVATTNAFFGVVVDGLTVTIGFTMIADFVVEAGFTVVFVETTWSGTETIVVAGDFIGVAVVFDGVEATVVGFFAFCCLT